MMLDLLFRKLGIPTGPNPMSEARQNRMKDHLKYVQMPGVPFAALGQMWQMRWGFSSNSRYYLRASMLSSRAGRGLEAQCGCKNMNNDGKKKKEKKT